MEREKNWKDQVVQSTLQEHGMPAVSQPAAAFTAQHIPCAAAHAHCLVSMPCTASSCSPLALAPAAPAGPATALLATCSCTCMPHEGPCIRDAHTLSCGNHACFCPSRRQASSHGSYSRPRTRLTRAEAHPTLHTAPWPVDLPCMGTSQSCRSWALRAAWGLRLLGCCHTCIAEGGRGAGEPLIAAPHRVTGMAWHGMV